MGMMSFIKEAGEKLFGKGEAKAARRRWRRRRARELAARNAAAGDAIVTYIDAQGLWSTAWRSGSTGHRTVTVSGGGTRPPRKRCCCAAATSSRRGRCQRSDHRTAAEPESQYHTVVKGDTLSKIAKEFYGDANKYPVIFEANKPMLTHPDKIYPGQMLRIPPA